MKLVGWDAIAKAWPLKVAEVQAACATTRTARIQALRQMLTIATDPEQFVHSLDDPRREWARFFDCTEWPGMVNLLEKCHLLGADGIGRLITPPTANFTATGEFARMAGWYHDLLRWPREEASARETQIIALIDNVALKSARERPTPAQISAIQDYLRAENLLTPKESEVFAKLAPADPKPGKDNPLALARLLTLPESAGMAQFARVSQAALDNDRLWLPATYFEAGGDVRNVRTPLRCHHVIHVIQLGDRTVKTIELPREEELDSEVHRPTAMPPAEPAIIRPVLLGEKHAYFFKRLSSPSRLYAIDRQTLNVSAVNLPLPIVNAMSCRTRGDTLYLAMANKWKLLEDEGRLDATAVIAVEGPNITETVISNQRKPAQTPLDKPDTWVDLIHVSDQRLVLLASHQGGYINPESTRGAARSWNSNTWTELSVRERDETYEEWLTANYEIFLPDRNLTVDSNKVFITEDPFDGEIDAAIALVNDAAAARDFRSSWVNQPSGTRKVRLVPVTAAPIEDPQMNRKMFTFRVPPEERKSPGERYRTATANEILKEGHYNVHILGKWRDQYLVFLLGEKTVPMPAIWTMSEAEFRQQVSKQLPW